MKAKIWVIYKSMVAGRTRKEAGLRPVEGFQHLAGRKVEFVQHHPVALPQCRDQGTLHEDQAALLVRDIRPQVLLQVRALVVVDADAAMPCLGGQVGHQRGLAAGGGALRRGVVGEIQRKSIGQSDVEATSSTVSCIYRARKVIAATAMSEGDLKPLATSIFQ